MNYTPKPYLFTMKPRKQAKAPKVYTNASTRLLGSLKPIQPFTVATAATYWFNGYDEYLVMLIPEEGGLTVQVIEPLNIRSKFVPKGSLTKGIHMARKMIKEFNKIASLKSQLKTMARELQRTGEKI